MKTTTEIKQFCKNVLGCSVFGGTSSGKGHWQWVRIPPDRSENFRAPIQWSKTPFPVDFRQLCIRTVYPNSPTLHAQTSAGNIGPYSISMYPHEWETVMSEYELSKALNNSHTNFTPLSVHTEGIEA